VNAPTGSTPKSSTASSKASPSTTPALFNDKLTEWEAFYNYHRPHGVPGGQTPTNASSRRPQERPPSKRSTSAAHGVPGAAQA
jgi:hypothetical protein